MLFKHIFASLATAVAAVEGAVISPRDVHVQPQRRSEGVFSVGELIERGMLLPLHPDGLQRRDTQNKSFDLSRQWQDETMFSAAWEGSFPRVPVAPLPVPITHGGSGKFNMTVQCVDCRTYGNIAASLTDTDKDIKGLNVGLVFNKVGALLDLSMLASGEGTYTIGLGHEITPIEGVFFSLKMGLAVDLIIQVTGEVKATGGLQLSVADGEKVGLDVSFKIDMVPGNGELLDIDASMSLVPKTEVRLLPLAVSHASANITAALRIKADTMFSANATGPITKKVYKVEAGAGAHMNLIEAKLGATFNENGTCRHAIHADANTNAGAFAKAEVQLFDEKYGGGPQVSTTFWAAGWTSCLADNAPIPTPQFISAKPPKQSVVQAIADGSCPEAVTETLTTAIVNTLTTCAVPEMNCPSKFVQLVQVTNTETITTTKCPGATGTGALPARASVSAPPLTGDVIQLTSNIVTNSLPPSYDTITMPANGTIAKGSFITATPPPPPPQPTLPSGGLNPPNNQEDLPGAGVALGAPMRVAAVVGFVSVAFTMMLM